MSVLRPMFGFHAPDAANRVASSFLRSASALQIQNIKKYVLGWHR